MSVEETSEAWFYIYVLLPRCIHHSLQKFQEKPTRDKILMNKIFGWNNFLLYPPELNLNSSMGLSQYFYCPYLYF